MLYQLSEALRHVALIVKLYVVSALAPDSVPVNVDVPTPVFNETPPGKAPDCKVIPVELVAVKLIVPMLEPPANEPKDPEPVVHVGTSDTVNKAVVDLTDKPSLFSALI